MMTKEEKYKELVEDIRALIDGEKDMIAVMSKKLLVVNTDALMSKVIFRFLLFLTNLYGLVIPIRPLLN